MQLHPNWKATAFDVPLNVVGVPMNVVGVQMNVVFDVPMNIVFGVPMSAVLIIFGVPMISVFQVRVKCSYMFQRYCVVLCLSFVLQQVTNELCATVLFIVPG